MRRRAILLLAPALFLLSPACGREDGTGGEAMPAARPPLHLVVSGTDREMGLAHGKALAKEIAEETGPRLRARLRAVATDAADAKFLEDVCRLYTTKAKPLLPPEIREELQGIAEGSGVAEDSILLLEVMREGLRFHLDRPPLLEASLVSPPFGPSGAVPPSSDLSQWPAEIVAAWDGEGGDDLTGHALFLERRPLTRQATLVVTWPGGLGAVAGVSAARILVAEGEVPRVRREQQTLNGVPFSIGLRAALERADSLAGLFAGLPRLSANRVLASRTGGQRRLALLARVDESSQEFEGNAWVLAPAGAGGDDPRQEAMDTKLGGYPIRPKAPEAVALAVAGRTSTRAAIVRVSDDSILWMSASGPRVAGVSAPGDMPVEFRPPPK